MVLALTSLLRHLSSAATTACTLNASAVVNTTAYPQRPSQSMEKDAWRQSWGALEATYARLEADISKHRDGPLLKGVLPEPNTSQHNSVLKPVAEVRQQLAELQQLVTGEGQANAAFIAALSDRLTRFAQQLTSIKQQQRQDYAGLLQQEQQLLEELALLELTLQDEDAQNCMQQPTSTSTTSAPHTNDWLLNTTTTSSSSGAAACTTHATEGSSASDCVRWSPDRPARGQHASGSSSNSPSKQPHVGSSTPAAVSSLPGGASGSKNNNSNSSGSLPPEVEAYDAFLSRHGPTGGWHPDDHKSFMDILKAHRGDYNAALAAAVDSLPLQTRQSVIAHCRWHADLCELDMRKRIALVNWRTAKEAAKAAFRAQAVALGDHMRGSRARGGGALAFTPPQQPTDQQEKEARQAKQQLLQQWKQEQQEARQEAARLAREQCRLQQQQEKQQRQQRQEQLKQRLQEARATKQQQEEADAKQAQLSQQSSAATLRDPEARQRLQQRNSAALERQRQLLAAKQERQAARERAQKQLLAATQGMRPRVDRDPNRLLAATTSAAARAAAVEAEAAGAKAQGSSRGQAAGGFVLHAGHRRATPGWAAGVSGL